MMPFFSFSWGGFHVTCNEVELMGFTLTSCGSPGTVSIQNECEASLPHLFFSRPKMPYQHLRERARTKMLPKASWGPIGSQASASKAFLKANLEWKQLKVRSVSPSAMLIEYFGRRRRYAPLSISIGHLNTNTHRDIIIYALSHHHNQLKSITFQSTSFRTTKIVKRL